jgi:hypothetical protein
LATRTNAGETGCREGGWETALTLEEFAELRCFTTGAFAGSVHGMPAKSS